jgi:hypothetical protein
VTDSVVTDSNCGILLLSESSFSFLAVGVTFPLSPASNISAAAKGEGTDGGPGLKLRASIEGGAL